MKMRRVPSSFSSTMCAWSTLSYRVWGAPSVPGILGCLEWLFVLVAHKTSAGAVAGSRGGSEVAVRGGR